MTRKVAGGGEARPNLNHHTVGGYGTQTPGNLAPPVAGNWRDVVLAPLLAAAYEWLNRSRNDDGGAAGA